MQIRREEFGKTQKGEKVFLYTLSNDSGVKVKIMNYGATITAIETPDRDGNLANIALGFDNFKDYISDEYVAAGPYLGAAIGRYANRIAGGKYSIDGVEYSAVVNNGPNSLHGGSVGFDKVIWAGAKYEKPNEVGVIFKYRSVDGEEGYPGNLDLIITYRLNFKGELSIEYKAVTDKTTVLNLTNHTYFNLGGNMLDHTLEVFSDKYTETDGDLTPTGEFTPVDNSMYDFRYPTKIGSRIPEDSTGYDNNYVLDNEGRFVLAAVLSEEVSGRTIEVKTTQPGIQVYTGYYLPEFKGHNGVVYGKYAGVALETQHYADSPNHPNFPTTELKPGDCFYEKTIYKFGVL